MSKRRGVSAQEKRARVLAQLRESKRPWTGKELEKSAKKLGFHPMAMGDVLQELLDDGLCCKEKIGSSNYIWSFPSTAFKHASKKRRLLEERANELEESISQLTKDRAALEPGRELTDNYLELQDELRTKKARLDVLESKLDSNRANDPEVLKELATVVGAKGQLGQGDGQHVCDQVVPREKRNMDKKMVANFLGMGDTFDYVE